MKLEAYIFSAVSAFLFVCAVVYGVWSHEPVGIVGLILSGGLCGLVGSYFWFISRRIESRPEDRGDADIAEGAGELGFFSPASYWPFVLGVSAFIFSLGTAFWEAWVMLIGGAALVLAVGGLVFEYYIGQNQS